MIPALLLVGGTVVDAGALRPDTDVLLVDGRIAAVGPDLAVPDGAAVLDVTGRWVAPGLIDAHVHLTHVPGEPYLPPDLDRAALIDAHLRGYLAAGVTTVLDAGADPAKLAAIEARVAAGAAGPRILSLGRVIGPHGGYPEALGLDFPGISGPEGVPAALDEAVAAGAIGAKLTVERSMSHKDVWPVFDAPTRAALRTEAAARGLPIYVHAMTPSDHLDALDLHPYAFVHAPEHPVRRVTAAIAGAGPYVITTLAVYDGTRIPLSDRLDEPLLRAVVPEAERAAAADRAVVLRSRQALAELAVPWAPGWAMGLDGMVDRMGRQRLRRAEAAVTALHAAGVPLVLGTDAGAWPLLVSQYHGYTAVRELELLVEAGLTPAEALAAGTTTSAKMLGLEGELGRVAPGYAADLVVLDADPLADPSAWRTVAWTVHDGVAKTPAAWLTP